METIRNMLVYSFVLMAGVIIGTGLVCLALYLIDKVADNYPVVGEDEE